MRRSLLGVVFALLAVALLSASGLARAQQPRVLRTVDDRAGSFSPNGRAIVVARFFSTQRTGVDTHPVAKRAVLILMRADGSGTRVLRHARATFEYDPSFSPDGRTIVFVRDDRIHLMRADGTDARPVRRDNLDQACPRFSPDGRRISLWRGRRSGSGAYYVMNSDGTGLRRISAGQELAWGCPSWFPDGKRIAFTKRYQLYVASADGRGAKRIAGRRDDTLYRPAVSPDGGWIACDGYLDGSGYGIILMRADGRGTRRLTTEGGDFRGDASPSWSPDGKRIVFSGWGRYEGAGVYVVNRDGTGRRRLSNFGR